MTYEASNGSVRRLLCVGFGYSARALAGRLRAQGFGVCGTSRSQADVAALRTAGIEAVAFDAARPSGELVAEVARASHVLVSVPPGEDGDGLLRHHGDALVRAPHLRWLGYLSTVGVYGNRGGAWVDEETPIAPASQRSVWRAAAEAQWLAFGGTHGRRVEVFRLAGIYGPGRSPLEALKAGTARRIVKPGQVFNRIHVDDIAAVLAAAIDGPPRHQLYNVADDEPAASHEVVTFAAGLLGVAPPPLQTFAQASLSPMARSFYSECKRVDNARLKAALGVKLAYPTYREGLAAVLAQMN